MRTTMRSALRSWASVLPLALSLAAPLHAQAPAPSSRPAAHSVPPAQSIEGQPLDPRSVDSKSLDANSVDDWDERLRKLQRTIWSDYSDLAPLGKDERDRTVSDDLSQWVMVKAVRARLDQARAAAGQALQAGDAARSRSLLEGAKGELDSQERLLERIGAYWHMQPSLRRQRQLLEHWGAQAPELLAASEARLQPLQTRLTQSYSPRMSAEELGTQFKELLDTYNRERIRIAGVVSARQDAAAQVAASRDRSLPCPAAAPGALLLTGDHPATPAASVAIDQFYPRNASSDGISGVVLTSLKISSQGCMEHGDVVGSSGSPALDDAALEVAEHVGFRPAVHNGQAVDSIMRMRFTFAFAGQEDTRNAADSPAPAAPPQPQQAQEALRAAQDLANKEDYAGAIARLDAALAQDPNNTALLVARAGDHWRAQQEAPAHADLDRALQLEPKNLAALRFKGYIELQTQQYPKAIATFSGILELAPKDRYALGERVDALLRAGDIAQALTYSGEIAAAFPEDPAARVNYARLLRVQHRPEESLAQAAALASLEPAQRAALLGAASIYLASGKPAEAMEAMNRAVTVFPSDTTYLDRASLRPPEDREGRLADIDAALKHVPDSLSGAVLLAHDQLRSGTPAAALAALERAGATHGEDLRFRIIRGIALIKSGQSEAGEAYITAARAHAQTAQALNTFCWELTIQDVELERAREACAAATQRDPREAAYQDSFGLVLLKLGDLKGALKAYDTALQQGPLRAPSRYGRALVRQRLGDRKGAAEDLDFARRVTAHVDSEFADYGLRPQP